MNCRKARGIVALRDGEDATPRECEALEQHLVSCDACSAAASSWRPLSLSRARSRVPLTDADYEAVRRSVMDRIEPAPQRVGPEFLLRVAAAGAFVILALVAGSLSRRSGEVPVVKTQQNAVAGIVPVDPGVSRVAPAGDSVEGGDPGTSRSEVEIATAPRETPVEVPAERLAVILPQQQENREVRIEMQTSDPNIRIIWVSSSQQPNESPEGVDTVSGV